MNLPVIFQIVAAFAVAGTGSLLSAMLARTQKPSGLNALGAGTLLDAATFRIAPGFLEALPWWRFLREQGWVRLFSRSSSLVPLWTGLGASQPH